MDQLELWKQELECHLQTKFKLLKELRSTNKEITILQRMITAEEERRENQ